MSLEPEAFRVEPRVAFVLTGARCHVPFNAKVPDPALSDDGSFVAQAAPDMECSRCHSFDVGRAHRRGWEKLISFFGLFPYRCMTCNNRFYRSRSSRALPVKARDA
jgi:hypothetical protein